MEKALAILKEQNNELKIIPDNKEDKNNFLDDIKSLLIGNEKLKEIFINNPKSIISGALQIYNAGLNFSKYKEQAYIIPYGKVAQVQISYKGFQKLFNESNIDYNIEVQKVFNKDSIRITGYNKNDFEIIEEEKKGLTLEDFEKFNIQKPIAFYGYIKRKRDNEIIYKELWTVKMLENFSKKFSSNSWENGILKTGSAWGASFNEMSEKTIIKSLIRKSFSLDLSNNEKLLNAITIDQASIEGDKIKYVDNMQEQPLQQKNNDPIFNEFEKLIKDREDKEKLLEEWEMTEGNVDFQKALFRRVKNNE